MVTTTPASSSANAGMPSPHEGGGQPDPRHGAPGWESTARRMTPRTPSRTQVACRGGAPCGDVTSTWAACSHSRAPAPAQPPPSTPVSHPSPHRLLRAAPWSSHLCSAAPPSRPAEPRPWGHRALLGINPGPPAPQRAPYFHMRGSFSLPTASMPAPHPCPQFKLHK